MPKIRAPDSAVNQYADLEDTAPKDFDPEDDADDLNGSDVGGSISDDEDPAEARGHYEDVGKSKLRRSNYIDLGPQYEGSTVSRDALLTAEGEDDPSRSQSEQGGYQNPDHVDPEEDLGEHDADDDEEIDSDEAFETGDDAKFEGYSFRGGRASKGFMEEEASQSEKEDESDVMAVDAEMEALDGSESDLNVGEVPEEDSLVVEMHDEEDTEDVNSDDTSNSDERDDPKTTDRAALRKMMAKEQQTVAGSLSKAAKADVAKGQAIKQQRTTFDALLNGRIKLQKALIATNSMRASETVTSDHTKAIVAAESAALTLWNNISTLRASLQPSNLKKRPLSATVTSPSSILWSEMQSRDSSAIPDRRAILTKWSQKTNPAVALTHTNKFSQIPSQQPLTSVLDQHLTGFNLEKFVQKTRIPRSCATLQAAARTASDSHIYDDADFYTLLLRELVDQRMADSNAPAPTSAVNSLPSLPSQRDFKVKKVVDTKASKGRKMRYTVHEKLQNFMAPDDRGSWGERQRGELFGSLLGRKVQMGEDEDITSDNDDGEMDAEMEGVEGGLRLFG